MDPISLAIGAVGLGMQIFGGISSAQNAAAQAKVSENEISQEQSISNAKQQAMEINGRRTQMENVRNNQRARAQATNSATNQGAQFGSGLQGGLAQVNDQSQFNMLGVNDALQTGRQIAGFNNAISGDKEQLAQLGSSAATDAGISSIGGSLTKSASTIGQLGKNAFGGSSSAPGSGGGMFFNNSSWGLG